MKIKQEHIHAEHDEGNPTSGGDGYWIELERGWKWSGDPVGAVHSIHADSKAKARREGVMPCDCKECERIGLPKLGVDNIKPAPSFQRD